MAEQQNSGGNDLQTFMGIFQQMIIQTQASQGGQRRLPAIDKLTKQEHFPVCRDELIRTLRRQDLDKYILTDVAEPQDVAARQRRENDKADVEDYIRAMVPGQKVWAILSVMRWDGTLNNPKPTFTLLSNYFEKVPADSNVMMLQEFATIRHKNFCKLETFQSRLNFLRTRLNPTTFKMSDDAFIWMTLKGIAKEYLTLELAMRLKNERKAKSTTGPLHQQSGNANTINADNNKKTVMFSTNYTMMAMPQFQEGPQRLDSVIYDSGCAMIMFNDKKWFSSLSPLHQTVRSLSSSGDIVELTEKSPVAMKTKLKDGTDVEIKFKSAVCHPTAPCNLIGSYTLEDFGVLWDQRNSTLVMEDGSVIADLIRKNNVPTIKATPDNPQPDDQPSFIAIPYIRHFRVYFCEAYYFIKSERRIDSDKFTSRARKGRLIGYADLHGKIVWIWDPETDKIIRANAVHFNKGEDFQPDDDEYKPNDDEYKDNEYEVVFTDSTFAEEEAAAQQIDHDDTWASGDSETEFFDFENEEIREKTPIPPDHPLATMMPFNDNNHETGGGEEAPPPPMEEQQLQRPRREKAKYGTGDEDGYYNKLASGKLPRPVVLFGTS
ncbi:hypothetical protein N0V88_007835 [Collariella sp. IMI 366227]|nr:hypothetical protein N0V88_007835 [Collariella sp. IMI 366227]